MGAIQFKWSLDNVILEYEKFVRIRPTKNKLTRTSFSMAWNWYSKQCLGGLHGNSSDPANDKNVPPSSIYVSWV